MLELGNFRKLCLKAQMGCFVNLPHGQLSSFCRDRTRVRLGFLGCGLVLSSSTRGQNSLGLRLMVISLTRGLNLLAWPVIVWGRYQFLTGQTSVMLSKDVNGQVMGTLTFSCKIWCVFEAVIHV